MKFLRMSFNGGTDARAALRHALEMLRTDGYGNADVLMVSDFVMDDFPDDLEEAIGTEKQRGTCFHSLVVGTSGNREAIKCFDHNWSYNTNDTRASRRLAEQLHVIQEKRK